MVNISLNKITGKDSEFISSIPQPTPEEIQSIEETTRGQGDNTAWQRMREGRITASNFYSVYTKVNTLAKNPTANVESLCNILLGNVKAPENVKSLKHGREMEPIAKESYMKSYRFSHSNVSFQECGLFIYKEAPFLSASPDMLVSCSCCGDGLLEVKCPLVGKCDTCHNFCVCNLPRYLEISDGKLSLKVNSAYYAQVQGQLAMTGRNWCDFFVYTVNGHFSQRISFDAEFFNKVLKNIIEFFTKFMVPRLLHPCEVVEQGTCQPQQAVDEPMDIDPTYTFCPICQCIIKELANVVALKDRSVCCDSCNHWYHYSCAKVTQSQINQITSGWFCRNCSS